jgi:hypothetical protein
MVENGLLEPKQIENAFNRVISAEEALNDLKNNR